MKNIVRKVNESEIINAWSDVINESLGENVSKDKLRWVAKIVDNQARLDTAINEDMAIRGQVPGMGDYVFPTAGNQGAVTPKAGSGDNFKTLLPIVMEVAGSTVGFDIVNVYPIEGPGGVVPYIDFVYANVYEAGETSKANEIISLKIDWGSSTPIDFVVGQTYSLVSDDGTNTVGPIELVYTGTDRLNFAKKHFKVASDSAETVGAILAAGNLSIGGTSIDGAEAEFATALVNHIQGYTTPGKNELLSNKVDGTKLFNPMSRGEGEKTQSKAIGLKPYTKPVEVGTISVEAKITREQLKDLPTQFGIDIISLVKDVLVEELSQTINKHILSKAFALGWTHHVRLGKSLNLNVATDTGTTNTLGYAMVDGTVQSLPILPAAKFISDTNSFENQNTAHARIAARILAVSNLIYQRGRRGPGNFVVTNLQVASALQANSKFALAPMANTLAQTSMGMYLYGTLAGMPVYVDPNMDWDDTRVLVGRKGGETEPGLKFVPYVLAESVEIIAESTMAPKVEMYSRYDLVEVGHYPETQYFTFFVKVPEGGLI